MKTNKFLLGLGLALLGCFSAKAQNGLQGIIVEKYYQSNAADAANASANGATLNVGSVTYRVFVDLAPGWKLNNYFGNTNHPLKITTTTTFFNDPNNGVVIGAQGTSTNNAKSNTRLIDSYLTLGSAAANRLGVLKTEDTDGSPGNTQNILQNNPGGVFGAPINVGTTLNTAVARDGMMPGTTSAPNVLGISTESDIFDQTPGGTFSVTNGVVAVLGGVVGTTTSNVVLLGQFTTDGVLGFELNVQVQNTLTAVSENWVANNPIAGEFSLSALTLAPPTVSITSPANNANIITGSQVTIAATAVDNGTVTSVQFLVDGTPVGTDNTAPFSTTYTATLGSHTITAIATDNDNLTGTSAPILISVANNQAPTVSVAAPAGAKVGDVLTFTATASDVDGTVASVSFSVDNVAIGTKTIAPYTYTWTGTVGSHNVKASATDNLGAIGVSAPVAFNVVNNLPPTVSVTSPTASTNYINATASLVVISVAVSAADADGTVTSVELLVNGTPVSTLTAGPFNFTYSPTAFGALALSARATDNNGSITVSAPVSVNVVNANQLPYEIGAVNQKCNQGTFCLPISAASTYTVDNVIGYDVVLTYNPAKVTPTGSVTVASNLITPSLVTVVTAFANGTMNISASFIGSAPAATKFNGTGEIFCVGFVKNTMADVDTAKFTVVNIDESYYTGVTQQTATAGRYTTYRDTLFNGRLKFASDLSPMKYNAALPNDYLITNVYGSSNACVTNTVAAPVQPNLNGDFVYNILKGNSINISRDILSNTSVQLAVQGNDAFIGRQILLNSNTVTPTYWQIIALDVNLDGIVSSGDISQINQRSVLSIPEFKQAWNYNAAGVKIGPDSKDYIFVDSTRIVNNPAFQISTTYPLNDLSGYSKAKVPVVPFCLPVPQSSLGTCPTFTAEVYKGIMLGDVDGNVATLTGSLQNRPSASKVIFDLENAIVSNGMLSVPVTFASDVDVYAYDFAVSFNDSVISYVTLADQAASTDALAHYNKYDNTLRMTATNTDLKAFAKKAPVAFVKLNTSLDNVTAANFKGIVGILNGQQVQIEVTQRTVGLTNISQENKVSLFPVPTEGLLNITSASEASVEIMDITGKNVLLSTTVAAQKTTTLDLSSFSNGVYMVKINGVDYSVVKKVIISK